MMSRTQITLNPELRRRARERAGQQGISLAEYLRRLVARDLGESGQTVAPASVFDLGHSGGSNIAADKDAMVGEAVAKENAGAHSADEPLR